MRELSLHIMDVIENGITAGADLITLKIAEDRKSNLLTIVIIDNGSGIPENILETIMDPFFTTRTTRRVGLGLSLFREASKRCSGEFNISSKEGEGTRISASFQLDHIDMAPVGDMSGSLSCLIMGNSEVDFLYSHEVDGKSFQIDTRHIRDELDGVPINNLEVIKYITRTISESLEELTHK
ncbi:ATP-binding protein [Deltaproteobacteria bacterium]|nr:ATP-binding protein [Deltaproteobacteria bacterium]